MTPAERKQKIEFHLSEINRLRKECQHSFKPLTSKQLSDEWMSVGAFCIGGCDKSFGWRCKKSPDGVCHYFSEDGKVELIDGTTVTVPADVDGHVNDPNYETEDSCLFCGHPEERK